VERAEDRQVIESALGDAITKLTGARTIRWVRAHEAAPDQADGECEFELIVGSRASDKVRFSPAAGKFAASSSAARVRLKTLCTLAACALARHDPQDATSPGSAHGHADSRMNADSASPALRAAEGAGSVPVEASEFPPLLGGLRDATFLHTVLPYALSQAQRHGEPLSVLCVAVDRLKGIRELLGDGRADHAVRNVGLYIARIVRSSDLVARLDDDRIIVVLPRAQVHDAWKVAQKICRTVEQSQTLLPEVPGLTVSIGVAEFPTCAATVFSLLDAADHALSVAKKQGRNRAIAAESLPDAGVAELEAVHALPLTSP
jgi:diguanylate cyclase (GGDEF)-like protein